MSTKIYNGFKFKTNNIFEINDEINKFREELKPLIKEKMSQYFAAVSVHFLDYNSIHGNQKKDAPFMVAFHDFQEKQREVKLRQIKDPSVDYSFSVLMIPYQGEFYGIYYTVQEDFAKLFRGKDFFEDYHYQNQSDKPDEISEEEWKERDKVWDAIFDKQTIPSLVGMTLECSLEESFDFPTVRETLQYVDTFSVRLYAQAKEELYTKFLENKNVSANNIIKTYRDFMNHLDSEEGKKEIEQIEKRIEKRLVHVITEEVLMGKGHK